MIFPKIKEEAALCIVVPPERLKANAERCCDSLKTFTSADLRNQVKRHRRSSNSAQTSAVWRMLSVSLPKTADRAEQLGTAESGDDFPVFPAFSSFLFSPLTSVPEASSTCACCPSNQIFGWDKTVEHNVPRRDLFFGSFAGQGRCTYNYHGERSARDELGGGVVDINQT